MNRGFTLLETIIYIAILALLIGGGIAAAFYIIDSSEKTKTDVNIQAEGHFFLRKIDWALNNSSVSLPATGSHGTQLSISKNGFASNPIQFSLHAPNPGNVNSYIEMTTAGTNSYQLTSDWINVEKIHFMRTTAPEKIEASSTIKGQTFTLTKYIR